MHHRLLLGSTALVSAGILFAGAAPARADIQVTLGGYTEFGMLGATDETLTGDPDRGYSFFMDNEIHITATGTSDSGMTYGSYVELEANSGSDGSANNATVDEVNLFFADGFGRVELGRQDGAEDVMFVGGEDAQSGTGGVDGDTTNLATRINVQNTGDAAKATYFTPRIAGFQVGASFIPDSDDDGGRDGVSTTTTTDSGGDTTTTTTSFQGGFQNVVGVGGNWVGAFGGVDLTLSAVGIFGEGEANGSDDLADYSIGGLIGVGGLSFGATFGQLTDANEADFAHIGLKYKFGNASASLGYTYNDVDSQDDKQNIFVVSGDVGLAPGLTLKGDVSYNTDDPGNNDSGGADQDDTVAGVLSVQLDY